MKLLYAPLIALALSIGVTGAATAQNAPVRFQCAYVLVDDFWMQVGSGVHASSAPTMGTAWRETMNWIHATFPNRGYSINCNPV